MNRIGRSSTLLLVTLCLLLPSGAAAEEPAREFLEALRERGYHDTALEYLDWLGTSRLAPDEIKETLLYEKAIARIAAAGSERDRQVARQQREQAEQLLEQFVEQRPQHAKAHAARTELAGLLIHRARLQAGKAAGGGQAPSPGEARKLYEKAGEILREMEDEVRAQLEEIPKVLDANDRDQTELAERRKQLRADYLDVKIRGATILEETAETFEKGAAQYAALLNEAADQYEEIYKRYRDRIGGKLARLYQGRANQKLGKLRQALGFYMELLDQPDSPEVYRRLKTQTLKLAMQCWLDPSQKKYVEAIRRGSEWVAKADSDEDRDPDWLFLRLMLAKAHVMQVEDLQEKAPEEKRTINRSKDEALKQAQKVADVESEYRQEAREIIALLGGRQRSDEKSQPRDFSQARKAGADALEEAEAARRSAEEIAAQAAREENAEKKAQLEEQLEEAREQVAQRQDDAIQYLRLALSMADDQTPREEVNISRYQLGYLYYLRHRYYQSAVLTEFVSRHHPGSAAAQGCAKIARACYQQLYNQSDSNQRGFAADRLISIAQYTVEQWPDSSHAEEALATLIPFMINARQLDQARDFLAKIPEDSPNRGEAELKIGRAMWQTYLQGMEQLSGWEKEAPPQEIDLEAERARLEELKQDAPNVLAAAYGRLQPDAKIDAALLTSLLSLAQAYVESEQASRAVEVLENADFGPLTLVRKDHPEAQGEGFIEETYRTALRAHIGSLSGAEEPEKAIQAAQKIMQEMRADLGGSPQGKERLHSTFVGVAQDLKSQLDAATPETRRALSKSFETFLAELSDSATELSVLSWVAGTFASLAESFDTGEELTAESRQYYQQAAATYQSILEKLELTPERKTQIRLRLAQMHRRQQKFEGALEVLGEILKENNVALSVQVDAAKTLQQWADGSARNRQAAIYERAIKGDLPDAESGKNTVWGWGKIAQVTARYPEFRDVFHEARYNLALCRFLQAKSEQGEDRQRLLGMAEKDVDLTKRLYGLGGDKWSPQYNALLKRIQRSKGKDPT